jgi:hypothetical protein
MFLGISLHIPFVQQKIVQFVAETASSSLNATFTLSGVDYDFWNTIVLKDVEIRDRNNKQVLSAQKISCSFESFDRERSEIILQSVGIQRAQIALEKDSAGVLNISYLFNRDTTKKIDVSVILRSVNVQDSHFSFFNMQEFSPQSYGINFADLDISDCNLNVSDISIVGDSIHAVVQGFSGVEKSGFILKSLSTDFFRNSEQITCSQVHIFTPDSDIHMDKLTFNVHDFSDFSDFIHKVNVVGDFQLSQFSFSDISYFAPTLQKSPYELSLAGNIKGTVANFKGKNMIVQYGKNTEFSGSVEIMGLPDISNTFVHIITDDFVTNVYDIEHIRIPPFSEEKKINVPSILQDIVSFSYSGNITGFFTDLVAYGTFTTTSGIIKSDISIKQSPLNKDNITISGDLSTRNFNIGKISKQLKDIGKINLNVHLKGYLTKDGFDRAFVKGEILDIVYQKYRYKNILVDGLISTNRFDGYLEIDDPNLQAIFYGLFDYSLEVPEFNFSADVSYADLHKLGFAEDSIFLLSFDTEVDFIGMSLDNLKGTIQFPRIQFQNSLGAYASDLFTIDVDNIGDSRNVHINSDLLDMSLNGKGLYAELPGYVYQYVQNHIAYLPKRDFHLSHDITPDFNISLHIKELDSLMQLFVPNIYVANNTYVNSVYSEKNSLFVLESTIPKCSFGSFVIEDISLSSHGNADTISVACIYTLPFSKKTVKDISTQFSFYDNQFSHTSSWNWTDSVVYSGNVKHSGYFSASEHEGLPRVVFSIPSQSIVVADSVWNIGVDSVIVDSSSIYMQYARIRKNFEKIDISGTISQNSSDSLLISFTQFNLDNVNNFIPAENIAITGLLDGEVLLQNIYDSLLVFADIQSDDFYFNGHSQGTMNLYSDWKAEQKAVNVVVSFTKGRTDILSFEGMYVPSTRNIDFNMQMKNYFLSDFQEILATTVENLAGNIDADLSVRGTLDKPKFDGNIEIKRGRLKVLATQCQYNMKGFLQAESSRLMVSDVSISDESGNTALATGYVDFQDMFNPSYLVDISTKKLQALHTKETDNEFVYGSVFFQGNTILSGDLQSTKIQVIGKTLENTQINIPLSHSELSGEHDFLIFRRDTNLKDQNIEVQTNNSGSSVEMDFDLTVTPDALCQIIFDKKVGDIIRVRGNSNLRMMMDKQGNLSLFGNYLIQEGDYLFTLKSLINKKFIIQKGGIIQWTGNPLRAQIDIKADYKLKASPKPAMASVVDSTRLSSYNTRIPVVCRLYLKNDLMNPDISYDILTPNADVQVKGVVQNFTEEEKNLQFISLLLANSFIQTNSQSPSNTASINAGTSFEALTSQMNYYLSQINEDVDVGLNYRPNSDFTSNEFELALSTQMLNDRVFINLNGYTEFGQENPSRQAVDTKSNNDFSGDISVEVKLNEQGNIRLKGFSRSNEDPLDEKQGNTNGVGLFFSKEFDSLRELFIRQN